MSRLDSTLIATLDHPCSQIKRKNGLLVIPLKYHELFLEHLEDDQDIESLPATQETWEWLQALYVTAFWLDRWYETDRNLATLATTFIDYDSDLDTWQHHWQKHNHPPFVRLVSLSNKNAQQPYSSAAAALTDLQQSARCQSSVEISLLSGEEKSPRIALREWVDLTKGTEYRCVVFENRLVRVVPDRLREEVLGKNEVEERCKALLSAMMLVLPCCDVVMDVWLSDSHQDRSKDLVVEFNSFGVIGNSHSDNLDWTDATLYLGEEHQL